MSGGGDKVRVKVKVKFKVKVNVEQRVSSRITHLRSNQPTHPNFPQQ